MLGITLEVSDISNTGVDEGSGVALSDDNFEDSRFLWVKVGTEVGPCNGRAYGRDFWNISVGSWTRKMDVSALGESLDA